MKVLLIGFFTRTYMPYIDKYENVLKEKCIDYDIVFFDRDSTKGKIEHNGNEYTYCHITTTSRIKKLLPVFEYLRFVKKLIRKNSYDKLVVMTTMPAVILKGLLTKKYRYQYIYDYRDTTYEHYSIFKKWVDQIIDNSAFTAMSSRGYLNVLNNNPRIVFNHNISNMEEAEVTATDLQAKKTITIGFLGYVRYFDVNSLLIKAFSDKTNYRMLYIGTPFSDCDLDSYAKEIGAKNVTVVGKYDNSNKAKLYKDIDIINSMYSLSSSEVQYAIPNRLYDAALFKKPLMTTKGTYLAEIVNEYGLGFSVDPFTDNIPEIVNMYIKAFDKLTFQKACERFLATVVKDEDNMRKRVVEFFS